VRLLRPDTNPCISAHGTTCSISSRNRSRFVFRPYFSNPVVRVPFELLPSAASASSIRWSWFWTCSRWSAEDVRNRVPHDSPN
jgi:hypothetical protein